MLDEIPATHDEIVWRMKFEEKGGAFRNRPPMGLCARTPKIHLISFSSREEVKPFVIGNSHKIFH